MEENHVSSLEELAHCSYPLNEDVNFQLALQCASPERRKELLEIQAEQPEFFLQECMASHYVASLEELINIGHPLEKDPSFQTALKCVFPSR